MPFVSNGNSHSFAIFQEPGTCYPLQSFMANTATKGFSLLSGLAFLAKV